MAREFCPSVCASHSRNVPKRQNIKIFHCLAVNSVHRSISVTQNTVGEILGHRYEGNRDVLFLFTVRRHASAVYTAVVSICLSVCLSQVGVLLKRLNAGSRKQRHTPSDSVF